MRESTFGFADGSSRNNHYTHPIMSHEWSFLEGDKRHVHTLKAGHHSFPFCLMLDGTLPSTLSTYTGDGSIGYKLRANVVRSGFAHNFHESKTFTLARSFTPEALEFNQTLEIENTWPGKIMYSLTLPFKAYAAGDDIPVNVKFQPIAKGVKVLTVSSVLKEYTLVHARSKSHPDSRVAASVTHEMQSGRAVQVSIDSVQPPPQYTGPPWHPTPLDAGPSNVVEDDEVGDDEINTSFSIPIPPWTTASHGVHPIFVTHKIKWSCSISNPDGHISELRCALPVTILDKSLLAEARAAGSSTRGLLFGGSQDAPRVDLPSYNNHVYDRVAVATALRSSGSTPSGSSPSGPASPVHDDVPPRRQLSSWADSELLLSLGSLHTSGDTPAASRGASRPTSRRSSAAGSRNGSRTSSPDRSAGSSVDDRRGSGFNLMDHLPSSFKMRPMAKPILRHSADDTFQRNAVSFTSLPEGRFHLDGADTPPEDDTLNRVPSYAIASRGFLGGGVVPLDAIPPMYDTSQRDVERSRSEGDLVRTGETE